MKKNKISKAVISIVFFVISLAYILPFLLLIGISFSKETDLINYGFQIIPRTFTTEAYNMIFKNPAQILRAFGVTVFYATVPVAIGIFLTACCGYAMAQKDFKLRGFVKIYVLITMFFSGGIVPAYILRTQYLGLQNNIWVYFFTWCISGMTVFIFRTFFSQLPLELFESARLDGASDFKIILHIVIPLSKAIIATYFLFGMLDHWNDYLTSLYYVTDEKLYTIQYLLQKYLQEAETIKQMILQMGINVAQPPTETLKFAVCVLGAVPMMLIFPLFQKFFSKGVMIGAVKG